MKTKAKWEKKNTPKNRVSKRPKSRKEKSNPLPIILISLTAFILFIVVILLATSNKTKQIENPHLAQINQDIQNVKKNGGGSRFTPENKVSIKKDSKTTEKTKPLEIKTETSIPSKEAHSEETKTEIEEEEKQKTEDIKESIVPKLPPKEQSIANLKKIGEQYKTYADNHRGHMPIELYQLDLNENDKVSPYTNSQYVMTQEGKGAPLKDSLESIIVREAKAVNGKYLCLLGNGEVKEFSRETVEE